MKNDWPIARSGKPYAQEDGGFEGGVLIAAPNSEIVKHKSRKGSIYHPPRDKRAAFVARSKAQLERRARERTYDEEDRNEIMELVAALPKEKQRADKYERGPKNVGKLHTNDPRRTILAQRKWRKDDDGIWTFE